MSRQADGSEIVNLEFTPVQTNEANEIPWQPVEGDELIGEYIAKKTDVGQYNYTVYLIRDIDDDIRSVFGCASLNSQMQNVEIGKYVKIVYNGMAISKNGRQYKNYGVYVAKEHNEVEY